MSQSHDTFKAGHIVDESWRVFSRNLGPLLGANLIMLVILCVCGMVPFGSLVLQGPLVLGMYKLARAAVRGDAVEFGDLFSGFQKFLPSFLASLLVMIFSLIGMIFCIVPGIVVSLLYLPVYLFILDDNLDCWDAMEASRKMVMNHFVPWLVLGLLLTLLNIVGLLACVIGLAITMPMTFVAITLAFDHEREIVVKALPPDSSE